MNVAGCPSIIPYLSLISNPQHIPLVTVILGIPVFQCIKKHFSRFIPNMLTRLLIGLFISMVNETLQSILIIMIKDQDFISIHVFCACLSLMEKKILLYKQYTPLVQL